MPKNIKEALGLPPASMVVLAMQDQLGFDEAKKAAIAFIEFELIKLTSRISVSGSLTDSALQFIAEELLNKYPNESLADFSLCFRMAAAGEFGDIWRLDSIVVGVWFQKYLDRKYEAADAEYKRQVAELYNDKDQVAGHKAGDKVLTGPNKIVDDEKAKEYLQMILDNLAKIEQKKIPAAEGSPRNQPHVNGYTKAQVLLKDEIRRQAFLFYKDKVGVNISKFHHWPVDDLTIFAATSEDAVAILQKAISAFKKKK